MTQQASQNGQSVPMRYDLRNRYVFEGKLEMKTGLHIGGGKATLSYTDSPVVLTPEELPYIPGSSFKGALRSTIEKLVASLPPSLGLHACGLPTEDVASERCSTAHHEQIFRDRRERPNDADKIMHDARTHLCEVCQLFGSPFAASRITVNDLYLSQDQWSGAVQVRDGVAIDRDSETAKPGLKYDFEVVPASTVFHLSITIENATSKDLQLISIGLGEFVSGFGGIGGFRSRGLGACILNELAIRYLKLDEQDEKVKRQRLQDYLVQRSRRDDNANNRGLSKVENVQSFFEEHINALFAEGKTR